MLVYVLLVDAHYGQSQDRQWRFFHLFRQAIIQLVGLEVHSGRAAARPLFYKCPKHLTMCCSEPGHRVAVAIEASRGLGR